MPTEEMTPEQYLAAVRELSSEKDFTRRTVRLAQDCGWLAVHFEPGIAPSGRWLTVFIGDPGFVDVIAVRGPRLVVAELKTKRNTPTVDQLRWLQGLKDAGAEKYVWYPRDWNTIVEVFR